MSEKPNDSPAFRLRPRAEPKSYYTVRLEYSANPAAFTRERPRATVGTKRRSGSSKASYSRSKQHCKSGSAAAQAALHLTDYDVIAPLPPRSIKTADIVTKEDLEREERHKLLKRGIAQSITADTRISPFLQRIAVSELRPNCIYGQNYITLRIEKVTWRPEVSGGDGLALNGTNKLAICRCYEANFRADDDEDSLTDEDTEDTKTDPPATTATTARLNVQLHNEYANERLLRPGKIMNIAKFRTGQAAPPRGSQDAERKETDKGGRGSASPSVHWIDFDVIVGYDANGSPQSETTSGSAATSGDGRFVEPLVPFVSITDMIEQPTEPFVEMAPPSPVPPQMKSEPQTHANSDQSAAVAAPVDNSRATYSDGDTSTNSASSAGTNKSTITDINDYDYEVNHSHHSASS